MASRENWYILSRLDQKLPVLYKKIQWEPTYIKLENSQKAHLTGKGLGICQVYDKLYSVFILLLFCCYFNYL